MVGGIFIMVSMEIMKRVDSMSRKEIAYKLRFGKSGDELFKGENYDYMKERFEKLGGWSPELSKEIGW